jgi:cytoskeletal protein RodZ
MAEKITGNNETPKPAESGGGSKDKVVESGGVIKDKAVESGGGKEKSAVSGDKVGDILKKERLTRRITVEAIAKDLKLNVGYLKALEAGDHAALPPEPYIRVYIKSLTKYLSLDTEAILREFDRERGLISDEYDKAANKIEISVQRPEKNLTLVVAAALIVALAVFAFIANQKGWLTQPEELAVIEEKPDTSALIPDSVVSEDSLLATLGAPETSAVATAKAAKTPPRP